jgi:hypothetical protein
VTADSLSEARHGDSEKLSPVTIVDEVVAVPQHVQSPTTFGPNQQYKAVPSVLEVYLSKGRNKVSIREASSEEAQEAIGRTLPIITDIPQLAEAYNQPQRPNELSIARPRISPAGKDPSDRVSSILETQAYPELSPHPVGEFSRSKTDSVRTSTTEIRLSAVSERDEISEFDSNSSTLLGPGSPPQRLASVMGEKPLANGPSLVMSHSSSTASMLSKGRADSQDSEATLQVPLPGPFASSPASRFSWQMSREEKARNWFTRWFIDWWAMEILSLMFSAICMTIIVTVLLKVDGKEIPKCK